MLTAESDKGILYSNNARISNPAAVMRYADNKKIRYVMIKAELLGIGKRDLDIREFIIKVLTF